MLLHFVVHVVQSLTPHQNRLNVALYSVDIVQYQFLILIQDEDLRTVRKWALPVLPSTMECTVMNQNQWWWSKE